MAAQPDRCSGCPYADQRVGFVPGVGPDDARLVVIGEAPGRDEIAADPPTPFIGKSGRILRWRLDPAVPTYITNVRKCLPPEDEDAHIALESINHCVAAYLQPEIDRLQSARAVHAVGADAARVVLGGGVSILEAQSSVFRREEAEAMAATDSGIAGLAEVDLNVEALRRLFVP